MAEHDTAKYVTETVIKGTKAIMVLVMAMFLYIDFERQRALYEKQFEMKARSIKRKKFQTHIERWLEIRNYRPL